MNFRVRIEIESIPLYPGQPPSTGSYPSSMAWTKDVDGRGDNPRFYADSAQRAIREATDDAIETLDHLVDRRGAS